jgi:hypothetical protein
MLKSAEKFSSIASAIVSPEGSTAGEKLFVSRRCPWGAWGINFYRFFIHFYHLANFKIIYVKASK